VKFHHSPYRLILRATAVVCAGVLTALGLGVSAASALTLPITPGAILPFATVAYDCTPTGDYGPTTQSFATGPTTAPPSGVGSLKFDLSAKDGNYTDLFRTDKYDDKALASVENLQYSTYVETVGKQPPYMRLSVDNDEDGVLDQTLFFFPANNSAQHAAATGVWQTWDVDTGLLDIDGDGGTPTTLAAYLVTNPTSTIVPTAAGGPESGGFGVIAGCGGANTAGSVTFVDSILMDLAGSAVDKFDLEPVIPARSISSTPASGGPGTVITVTGSDCFEPSVGLVLGKATGQSGGPVDTSTATPGPRGNFSGTLTVPANSEPNAFYSVLATCGTAASPAFAYPAQPFDVPLVTTTIGADGYRMVAGDGGIFTFGARSFHGSEGGAKLNKPIVGGATDPSTFDGYWMVASDGGVFSFNVPFYGSLGGQTLSAPAVEIEPTTSGKGYWIVLADGTVRGFGNAGTFGDMSGKALNKPIVGMSVTPSGNGYWLLGGDGGIFAFGDAQFFGSTGDKTLNAPVIDLAPAVDNNGYYLLASDGGVFTFGSPAFYGSTGNMKLNAPVVAMLLRPSGTGYWLAAADGGIFTFGDVQFHGSMGGTKLNSPVLDLIG
jgi:hypothetical protein